MTVPEKYDNKKLTKKEKKSLDKDYKYYIKKTVCDKCKHGMILHGSVNGIGYCSEGNGTWCKCKVKGLNYDEEIKLL